MTKLQFFRRFLGMLPQLSTDTGYPMVRLLFSYAVCYIFHGANSEEFCALRLYKYTNRERRRFLLYRGIAHAAAVLNRTAGESDFLEFDDKSCFNRAFSAFIRRDWLYLPDSTEDDVRAFMARHDRFLAKATVSTQGKNIYLYEGGTDPAAVLAAHGGKPFLLETFITQHPDMEALNPSTVNTVRVLALQHEGDVLLVGACVRCGGSDAFVDNFHSGGVAYPIDLETGVVCGRGRRLFGTELFLCHPSTGRVMPGFRIPHWDMVRDAVCRAAAVNPRIGCIGWDIAVLPDGVEIVEGNNDPDPIVVQLDDRGVYPKVKDFLKKHGL